MNGRSREFNLRPSVLVVEDEALIRVLLIDGLEEAGFQALEAESADEALALLMNDRIDLVVTDVRMPGSMDGLGLARWMHEQAPNTPVIVTSGFVTAAEAFATNPAIAYVLDKPYNPTDIVAKVAALIRQS